MTFGYQQKSQRSKKISQKELIFFNIYIQIYYFEKRFILKKPTKPNGEFITLIPTDLNKIKIAK